MMLQVIVWLMGAIPATVCIVNWILNTYKQQQETLTAAIEQGLALPKGRTQDYIALFIFGVVSEFVVGSIAFLTDIRLAIGINGSILLLFLAVIIHNWIIKNFYQQEHVVLRQFRAYPELLQKVLDDKFHAYYEIAQQLQAAGKVTINKATGMVEIDGKNYKVEVK